MAKRPIQTGSEFNAGPWATPDSAQYAHSLGVQLFHQLSRLGEVFSPPLRLKPGEAAFIDVYNLPEGGEIYTNRIIIGSFAVPCGGTCPPPLKSTQGDNIIMAEKRMTLGNPDAWIFYNRPSAGEGERKLQVQMVITLPGDYRFELSDEGLLGQDMILEYRKFDLDKVPGLPKEFQGGVL